MPERTAGSAAKGAGYWWSAVHKDDWPKEPEALRRIQESLQGEWGDRRQELVFIGIEIDKADLTRRLDACLLTDEEVALGRKSWKRMPDPFPTWRLGR
jgi:G3E family GTPase